MPLHRLKQALSGWLTLVSMSVVLSTPSPRAEAQDLSRFEIRHPSGVGELFHGGVYTYLDIDDQVGVENHVRKLAQSGMTHLYVTSGNPEQIVLLCRKYGCYVSNQVGWGYLGDDGNIQAGAAEAIGAQIQSLLQYPEYLTTSVREEPPDQQWFIDNLFTYYSQIDSFVSPGSPPFYLLFNGAGAASKAAAKPYRPLMTGYDRTYLFIWNYDAEHGPWLGLLMNPRRALFQIDIYLREFMPHVNVNQQFPVAVLLGGAATLTRSKQELANAYDNGQLDGPHYTRWKGIASLGGNQANQGLKLNGDGSLTSSSFYMPPPNCMSAQVWLALANGYRGAFSWLSQPTASAGGGLIDLNGPQHKGSATQDELARTVRELQKFGWIINHMRPSTTRYISHPNASYLPNTYSGSFTIPGYSGKIAVLVNADVATYANGEGDLQPTHIFRIDDNGNVNPSDYTPNTQARAISVTNTNGSGTMYDLETGTAIGTSAGSISVLPGKGKFIFIGSSAELTSLRAKTGITSITKLSGLIPNREEIQNNLQLIHASDPKVDNTNYLVFSQPVALNKRYRLIVTASSDNGAQLGALYGYDAGGTYPSTHLRSARDGNLLWNRALSATPTTFVSEDFTITSGSTGYVWFYRANQAGTLKIHDAWVEDCSSHRVIPAAGWVDSSKSFPLSGGASYQVYARARNYEFESQPAQLGVQIQEFNAFGSLLGTYNTTPAISGAPLGAHASAYKATFTKRHSSAVSARVKFINSAGAGTLVLESATVGRLQ